MRDEHPLPINDVRLYLLTLGGWRDMKKANELGISKAYLELEYPSTVDDYLIWLGYQNRTIYFNDDIDASAINRIVHWINIWNKEDEGIGVEDRKHITISITSNGGDVVAGFALLDAIEASKTPVITEGVGCCASMGILLLMSGHYRRAYANTVLLIHDGSMATQGTSNKVKSTMRFYERLDERVKQFILKRTTISDELYEENADIEWYMFADDEGIKYKIVDEIIKA